MHRAKRRKKNKVKAAVVCVGAIDWCRTHTHTHTHSEEKREERGEMFYSAFGSRFFFLFAAAPLAAAAAAAALGKWTFFCSSSSLTRSLSPPFFSLSTLFSVCVCAQCTRARSCVCVCVPVLCRWSHDDRDPLSCPCPCPCASTRPLLSLVGPLFTCTSRKEKREEKVEELEE